MAMHSRIIRRTIPATLALLFTVRPALAEPTANEIAVARQLFKEATDLEAHEQWADAAAKLRAAIAIKDTPGLRFHLAHAEVEQGLVVEALVDYDRADDLIRAGASAPDVADVLADARNAARQRVAMLSLHVRRDPSAAELTLDGKPVAHALLEQPIPVNPGTHHVEVRVASRRPFISDVQLTEGEHRDLDVVIEPAQVRTAAPETRAASVPTQPAKTGALGDGGRGNLKLAVLVGESALAAVGLAIGVGYTIARNDAVDSANRARSKLPINACNPAVLAQNPMYAADCSTLRNSINDANRDRSLALGGFIGAGVAGASLVATGLFWHREARTTGGVGGPFDVAANVTGSGFDLRIGGRF